MRGLHLALRTFIVLSVLLHQIKQALKTPGCLLCYCTLGFASQTQWFCKTCEAVLGIAPQQRPLTELSGVQAICPLGSTLKNKIYAYKFYGQKQYQTILTGILNHYRVHQKGMEALLTIPPQQVLVTVIPPHSQFGREHMNAVARCFANQWHYTFNPDLFTWTRSVTPQHDIHNRQQRFRNILRGYAARRKT
jgi:predicted amidophosphoribosyltransferase